MSSDTDKTHEMVQRAYGDVARKQSSCCGEGSSCCGDSKAYTVPDHPVPEAELGLSCGNPLAFGYINNGDVVLDVRTDGGVANRAYRRGVHTPTSDLIQHGTDLPKQRHITAVCGSGYRSNIAGSFLKSLGYEQVFSLIGGMTAWKVATRTA